MLLVTAAIRRRLVRNGRDRDADQVPILKVFDPCGAATWLITQMDPDEQRLLFGLCDLGMGFPEIGHVDLLEMQIAKGALGIGLERDMYFTGRHPLSVYARAARTASRIVEDKDLLDAAQAAIAAEAVATP